MPDAEDKASAPSGPTATGRDDATALPPPEVVVVDDNRVSCDGGGGALGHPKVWYELGDEDFVDCGYCDRRFARRGSAFDPGTAE